ncbi:MAG: glycosyltransferase family 39 protein [Anaerolineae bacterium]|nr:glycosyltransferase family 39 protein [Anaerolineae bacterium]
MNHLSDFLHSLPRLFAHPLVVLLLGFIVLTRLHGSATPVFEAPDEVWHYAYVRWLVQGNGLPSLDDNASGANQEAAQPPLYYVVAALFSTLFDDSDLHNLMWHNPNFGYQALDNALDNKNMLIHTEAERFPWRGSVLAIHVTRLTSLLFGILTVIAVWGIGYEVFQTRKGALITAALVAFQPQFVFMCGVINNDSAAAALSTAALWVTARVFRRGFTVRRAAVLGVLVGMAILSKTSALALLFAVGAALCWQAWRERLSWKTLVIALCLYLALALGVGGWWYARNLWLYGDLLGVSRHFDTPWRHVQPKSLLELLPDLPLLLRSFWGAYGWGHIFWPDWVYVLLTLIALACFVLGIWHMLSDMRARRASPSLRDRISSAESIYLFSALWLAAIGVALLYWMRNVGAPHGRLLFPAVGAWAVLVAYGVYQESVSPVWRALGRVLILSMAVLATLAPGARIQAAFAPPRLYAPQQVEETITLLNFDYDVAGQTNLRIRLLGVDFEPERVTQGDILAVKACWEALVPIEEDYTIYAQLLGQNYTRAGERHTYPGLGRYPTSLWTPGMAFCDVYRIAVESWVPAPECYQLLIGLYLDDSRDRLTAFDSAGQSLIPPIVGAVSIVPETPLDITPEYPVQYVLGESILLQGYDLSGAFQSGTPLTLTLYWQAQSALDRDYTVFVHLLDEANTMLAQDDDPPRAGWYPTSAWEAGDVVVDVRQLDIPEIPTGQTVYVSVGMYLPDDLTRLPVTDDTGQPLPNGIVPLFATQVDSRR